MIPTHIFDELAKSDLDKVQAVFVMRMINETAAAAVQAARREMLDEMAEMRSSFGRLIIEAVSATEEKIFARLEAQQAKEAEVKRERRERLRRSKREREALREAGGQVMGAGVSQMVGQVMPVQTDAMREAGQTAAGVVIPQGMASSAATSKLVLEASKEIKAGMSQEEKNRAALIKEWEAKQNEGVKPVGKSLAGVMHDLGKSLAAQLEAEIARDEEEARLAALANEAGQGEGLNGAGMQEAGSNVDDYFANQDELAGSARQGVDELGVDELGVDELGVDELGVDADLDFWAEDMAGRAA